MAKKELKTNAMRLLDRASIEYRHYRYECDEFTDGIAASDIPGLPHELVYKTLVTAGAAGEYYVFVIPVEGELDLKKAARSVGVKSLEMLKLKDLRAVTGYVRGGVSPIGMKKALVTRIDLSAKTLEKIIVSGGRVGSQIELSPADLLSVTGAEYADLTRSPGAPQISEKT